jgi:outer membrane protein assembly factor BamB
MRRRSAPGAPGTRRRALPALALATLLVLAGCTLPGGSADDDLTASVDWVAGNSTVLGNHHSVGVGRLGPNATGPEGVVVAVPLGGRGGGADCRLLALNGSGEERWTVPVPPEHCTIHAVADPVVADFVGGPAPEVVVSTTEAETVAYAARTGQRRFAVSLTDYGYTRPVVADLTGDAAPELVTQDVRGELYVVRPSGVVWRRSLDAYTFADPAVADFDADGAPELVAGVADVAWATHADVDGDPAVEFLLTTVDGTTLALDGATGEPEWRFDGAGDLAAVGPAVDGDGDGDVEVHVTGSDARVRALNGSTGAVEWTSDPLSEAPLRSVPPAVAGDVDGDGRPAVVATTGDGVVAVLGAEGEVRARFAREDDVSLYTAATTADIDGDGRDEVLVPYGDGRVHALSFD